MSSFFVLTRLLVAICALSAAAEARPEPHRVVLEIFTREGCPHCDEAKRFLAVLHRRRPNLDVVERDVVRDPHALERLRSLARKHGVEVVGVPTFFVAGELVVGYLEGVTDKRLEALVERAETVPHGAQSRAGACLAEETGPCEGAVPAPAPEGEAVEIPILGHRLTVSDVGLPAFTFALGLLDGFNPCSMWVLILMLSLLASLRDRLRMLAIAGTFIAVQGLAYFAFMAAWLNAFLLVGLSRASEVVLGGIACLAGFVHLKDFWALGRGISLSIPRSAKPGIYARMRGILVAENLPGALAGTFVLAILVQIVELLCTSGFPALYTRILTLQRLEPWSYYGYLLLYDFAYVLDDVFVLAIGVATLSQRRLQEREGRWLKLVSGAAMVGLGVYLLVGSAS
jgi:glutaredoxin